MAADIKYWLRKRPQPVAILADAQRIEVGKGGRAWRDLTKTIAALEPSKLTALDGQGSIIRVLKLDEDEDDKPAASPEMTDLQFFAKLLAEAYDKGASKNQPVIDSAMQYVERITHRLTKEESESDRLRNIVHKQHLQIVELTQTRPSEEGGEDSFINALVSGAMQAGAAAAAKPKQPKPLEVSNNGKGPAKQ